MKNKRKCYFAGTVLNRQQAGFASLSWFCFQLARDSYDFIRMTECKRDIEDLGIDFKRLVGWV